MMATLQKNSIFFFLIIKKKEVGFSIPPHFVHFSFLFFQFFRFFFPFFRFLIYNYITINKQKQENIVLITCLQIDKELVLLT